MSIQEHIKSLISEGKEAKEIAEILISSEDVKEAGLSSEEIASKVFEALKSEEAVKAFEALEAEEAKKAEAKAKESELAKSIKEGVQAELKSININPTGKYKQEEITKRFDYAKGEFVEDSSSKSEAQKVFNTMIKCIASGDDSGAFSASKEIDQDNSRYGTKATVRSDSDSVGGYSIPTEVSDEIMQLSYEQSVMLPKVNRDAVMVEDKIYPTIGDITVDYVANQDTALTESNPTFSNPTINLERVGAWTNISNTILRQKGANLTNAFTLAYASANARFIDKHLILGNITGNGDLQDGLVWLGTTTDNTALALTSLADSTLTRMVENMDDEFSPSSTVWIGNHKVKNQIGLLENGGGNYLFPNYVGGGDIKPLGYEFLLNTKITSVLQVSEDDSTGGTDDVLLLADLSKFIVGIRDNLRIDTSSHFNFTKDVLTMRGIQSMGWGVLFADCIQVQELTN
jgi:HK97 family phage major capsid protein